MIETPVMKDFKLVLSSEILVLIVLVITVALLGILSKLSENLLNICEQSRKP